VPDLNIGYYQHNAGTFFADTVEVAMTPLYRHFLPLLPDRGRILDAGCGSGRDAKAFSALGHQVTAFDASPALIALAERNLGQPVHCLRFQDITWQDSFDGIWACASLLHVPAVELPDAMQRLCRALEPGGILYASFK
jgi:SAM-dependent methyltransferase